MQINNFVTKVLYQRNGNDDIINDDIECVESVAVEIEYTEIEEEEFEIINDSSEEIVIQYEELSPLIVMLWLKDHLQN